MAETICLDEKFSTTKMLIQEKPILEKKPTDQFDSVLFLPENSERKSEGGLRTKGYFKRFFENKPLISIITVVFNGEKYLEQTIQSVITQNYDNVEYIIIDGGSIDGTLEIIKNYEGQIDYWVSEKDQGIYDAMKKGLRLVSGNLVGYINADDYYMSDILSDMAEVYQQEHKDVIYGDVCYIDENRQENIPAHSTGIKYGFHPYSLKWIWVKMLFAHPASFISLRTYKKYGDYDRRFKIAADYDLFIRLVQKRATFYYYKKIFSGFREGGISTTDMKRLQQENFEARKKNSIVMAYSIRFLLNVLTQIKKLKKRISQ